MDRARREVLNDQEDREDQCHKPNHSDIHEVKRYFLPNFDKFVSRCAKRDVIATYESLATGTVVNDLTLLIKRQRGFDVNATDVEVGRKLVSIVGHFLYYFDGNLKAFVQDSRKSTQKSQC